MDKKISGILLESANAVITEEWLVREFVINGEGLLREFVIIGEGLLRELLMENSFNQDDIWDSIRVLEFLWSVS